MPILTAVPIKAISQDEFHQIDRRVTGLAFEIHNEFGRYLDERLYRGELNRRCQRAGLRIEPEMRMTISYGDFSKCYFADHLIDASVIVESKAVSGLGAAHKAQTLTYLFLCGLQHATLLNFRTERVQHEFVSTRWTQETRRRFAFDLSRWKPFTPKCHELQHLLSEFLYDWGAFLDPLLYRDALTHFFGGETCCLRDVQVFSANQSIGAQKAHLLTDDIAFSVTASVHRPDHVYEHHRRFLSHTRLRAVQWINLNRAQIELHTIERP